MRSAGGGGGGELKKGLGAACNTTPYTKDEKDVWLAEW